GLLRPVGAPDAPDAPDTAPDAPDAPDTAAGAATTPVQGEGTGVQSSPTTAAVPDATGWRELSPGDRASEELAGDPVTAVSVDVAGWRMTESTSDSEIWTSDDGGMRVLIAARPTPVGTQDELDAAMLGALDGLDGNGGIRVTERSPVAYEEYFPDSTTSWRVRLVDGHQVSVGCQYREVSEDRREVCERFTATARVSAATG
ncbi:MAG: type VII secretion-associated protein, partial [Corynebacterium sp.]|uniref:type VII secretion-associated protein n=1 Tax=Corynebacterium sp. TaxID=1720 RepID=UPI003F08AA41